MKDDEKPVGPPAAEKPTLYDRIKKTLVMASQLVIAAPVKLPPKVVLAAKYLALALGALEAVEGGMRNEEGAADESD